MKVQSSNYIPVNRFSREDLIKEEISNNKEIIQATKEEIQARKEIISNNNKLIDTLEKGLAELAPFKAYCIEQLRLNANTAYNSSNNINSELSKVDNLHNKVNEFKVDNQDLKISKVEPLNNKAILREADLRLELGNTKEALKGYNKIIFNRENKPIPDNYRPIEEKLRQASKLYTEFQPLVENLNINNALKLKLYCTGIAAHTTGIFSLSKAKVLHMINNLFFYPSFESVNLIIR
jgi:hypothetical protein